MNTDLIEKRDERTRKRKQVKRKMDSVIGLSYHDKDKKVLSVNAEAIKLSDNSARLIDEGYIDNGFVIKKGALEKYLKGQNQYVRGWEFDGERYVRTDVLNLSSDFVGNVNLGHIDFATLPIQLGYFTRDDLTLVDTDNGRKALDVQLHLDEESMLIKELKRQPYDIGISAEFWVHENVVDSEALSETLGYYLPVFDEIFIFAYGLVGECGNVNSSGLELTKENAMPNENIEMLDAVVEETEEAEEAETLESETEIPPTEEEIEEEITQEVTEEESEPVSEEESEEEETNTEEVEEVEEITGDESDDDEDEEDDESDGLVETLKTLQNEIETLTKTVAELTEANASLKKTNRKLSNKLQSEKAKKETFIQNVKGLSVQLLPEEDKKPKEEKKVTDYSAYYNGDGIGEL